MFASWRPALAGTEPRKVPTCPSPVGAEVWVGHLGGVPGARGAWFWKLPKITVDWRRQAWLHNLASCHPGDVTQDASLRGSQFSHPSEGVNHSFPAYLLGGFWGSGNTRLGKRLEVSQMSERWPSFPRPVPPAPTPPGSPSVLPTRQSPGVFLLPAWMLTRRGNFKENIQLIKI